LEAEGEGGGGAFLGEKWGVSKMTPFVREWCHFSVIFGKNGTTSPSFFLGTLIFGVKSMIPIFENDTGGELIFPCFWFVNGDFF
jgi:hypothetical protein